MGRGAIAAAAFALGALNLTPSLAQDRALLQLDWIPTGEHAAYFAGAQRGFWRENGIELSLTRGYGSGDTVTKLAAGAAQFGVADLGAVLAARARQNMPVRSVSAVYTHSPHSLFVLRSSGITTFKGLEGKRISITPGNSHRLYFPEVARRAGTDPERISWVNTDASAMAAMLIAKRVDAAPFYSIHHYYQNKAARRAGEEITVLPFVETGFAIYAASLVATDDMIGRNPDLVRRFLAARSGASSGRTPTRPRPAGSTWGATRRWSRTTARAASGRPWASCSTTTSSAPASAASIPSASPSPGAWWPRACSFRRSGTRRRP